MSIGVLIGTRVAMNHLCILATLVANIMPMWKFHVLNHLVITHVTVVVVVRVLQDIPKLTQTTYVVPKQYGPGVRTQMVVVMVVVEAPPAIVWKQI